MRSAKKKNFIVDLQEASRFHLAPLVEEEEVPEQIREVIQIERKFCTIWISYSTAKYTFFLHEN